MNRRLAIFDEAQSWPELFPRLPGAIDRERERTGRFLLTGSVSPGLMRDVSESLAGRLAVIEMSPFQCRKNERPFRIAASDSPEDGRMRPAARVESCWPSCGGVVLG